MNALLALHGGESDSSFHFDWKPREGAGWEQMKTKGRVL
jgi:hypothetical protein